MEPQYSSVAWVRKGDENHPGERLWRFIKRCNKVTIGLKFPNDGDAFHCFSGFLGDKISDNRLCTAS
jgi:hypothetical protein